MEDLLSQLSEHGIVTEADWGETRRLLPGKWLVLGPFTTENDRPPETEFFYERGRALEEPYLASSGGERDMLPLPGMQVQNNYFGDRVLVWHKLPPHRHEDTDMLFDGDYDAIYRTIQRSCVYYLCTYLHCARETPFVMTMRHTGLRVYCNEELIYERAEGFDRIDSSPPFAVVGVLRPGLNRLLFKLRTGSIADGVDFSVRDLWMHTARARADGLFLAALQPRREWVGSPEAPRQSVLCIAGALSDTGDAAVTLAPGGDREELALPALQAGEAVYATLSLPAPDAERETDIDAELRCGGVSASCRLRLTLSPFDGFTGPRYTMTNFHFDTTYHEEQRIYALGALGIMKRYAEALRADPAFKATASAIDYLLPYLSLFPGDRELILRCFREGRLEPDDFYNQPNEMTSSSEGFARNAIYGQIFHRDVTGRICHVYSPNDVFGHPNQLSQICRKVGCSAVSWGKAIIGFSGPMLHLSPDGEGLWHKGVGRAQAAALGCGVFGGDAHPRLDFGNVRITESGAPALSPAQPGVPSDVMVPAFAAEKRLRAREGRGVLEPSSRDMSLYHIGSAASRADLKEGNRLAENLLITAEKLSVIAAAYGARYPEEMLDKAWRQLLCGQHHDSITGTHNELSFIDLLLSYRESVQIAAETARRGLAALARGVRPVGAGIPVTVFNPMAYDRTDRFAMELTLPAQPGRYTLVDPEGKEIPFQLDGAEPAGDGIRVRAHASARVPATGLSVFRLIEKPSDCAAVTDGGTEIENEFFRLRADPALGGGLVSIYDKEAGKEVLKAADGPGNRVNALKEEKYRNEALHEFYTTGEHVFSSEFPARVTRVRGRCSETLVIESDLATLCGLRQTVTLTAGVRRIDFITEIINYQKRDHLFTVTFPVNAEGARPVFDDRYSVAVRGESRGLLDFRTQHSFMFSHCAVYAADRFLEYGPSVTLRAGAGRGAAAVSVGMSALIRGGFAGSDTLLCADRLLAALTRRGVPVSVYGDRQPEGTALGFNQDLFNTDTRFVLRVEGEENRYADALLAGMDEPARTETLGRLRERGYAFALLCDSDNLWRKPIDVLLILASGAEGLRAAVGLFERSLKRHAAVRLQGCAVCGPKRRVEDYGTALINTGTPACSVERGGVLNLILFHTAMFYGNIRQFAEKGYVPEHKTHVFRYALYPHRGDFRSAGVCRTAEDVNNPFLVCAGTAGSPAGFLPSECSFLRASDSVMVTAMKAGGYPLASMRSGGESIAKRGIAVRYYEPFGESGRAELEFGFDVGGARQTDLLENPGRRLPVRGRGIDVPADAYSIETVTAAVGAPASVLPALPSHAPTELFDPCPVRSWDLSLGCAATGFLAVAAFLGRDIAEEGRILTLPVHAVNNSRDTRAEGSLRLELPEGWKADRTELRYNLKPGAYATHRIRVIKPDAGAKGLVYLHYKWSGIRFYDVLEIGRAEPELSVRRTGEGVEILVRNTASSRALGALQLASPVETWDAGGLNPLQRGALSPWCFTVDLAPGETGRYLSRWDGPEGPDEAFWACAKLMLGGRLYYAYTKAEGTRNIRWNAGRADRLVRERGYDAYLEI